MGKKSRRPRITSRATKPTKIVHSVDELLDIAESLGTKGDPMQQISILMKAIQQLKSSCAADNFQIASVIGKCAECKASIGDAEGASVMFHEGIRTVLGYDNPQELIPRRLHENINICSQIGINDSVLVSGFYFYLGQLHEAEDALQFYMDGITLLETTISAHICNNVQNEPNSDRTEVKMEAVKQLCNAYCSVADLYLTDLCFEENAESQCEAMFNKAAEVDTTFQINLPDPWQGMANLRLSQRDINDVSSSEKVLSAFNLISKSFTMMEEGCNALAKLVGIGADAKSAEESANELDKIEEATNLPGYEFREQTAKILLECASLLLSDSVKQNQCCEAAIQVLGSLLAEDDEVAEVWYLMGCAFLSLNYNDHDIATSNKEHASFYLNQAIQILKKSKKGAIDKEEKDEINQHIVEVQNKLNLCNTSGDETTMMDEDRPF